MLFSEEFAASRINAREAAGLERERELLRAMRERRETLAAEAAASASRAARAAAPAVARVEVVAVAPVPAVASEEPVRELAPACQ